MERGGGDPIGVGALISGRAGDAMVRWDHGGEHGSCATVHIQCTWWLTREVYVGLGNGEDATRGQVVGMV